MVLILDGGSTSVLEHISQDEEKEIMRSPLWTSQAIFDHPQAVCAMYRSYIDAGAQLISCMTYQQSSTTMSHLTGIKDAYNKGMQISLDASGGSATEPVLTLGTQAAMLANGAEYSHQYREEDKPMLRAFHKDRLDKFAAQPAWARIKYIAFETLPDVLEAQVILDVLQGMSTIVRDKKMWISFSCSGDNSVEKVLSGVDLVLRDTRSTLLWGLGINCFKEDVAQSLVGPFCEKLRKSSLYAVVYPDAGLTWNATTRTFSGSPLEPAVWARRLGAVAQYNDGRIVLGGCCQTGPAHISALCKILASHDNGK